MKIDRVYDAVFNHGQAGMRSGKTWFIYKPNDEQLISKVSGLNFRDLLASRKEVFYPSYVDIMADDWILIDFSLQVINGFVLDKRVEVE